MSDYKQILLVEDDPTIAEIVRTHLESMAFQVNAVPTVSEGLATVSNGDFDMIILDRMLPDGDGLDICRAVKRDSPHTPVLMLTSRGEELDKVLGLELGADDYMTKPFGSQELLARVRALFRLVEAIRSSSTNEQEQVLSFGSLEIHPLTRRLFVSGEELQLTLTEFDILLCLAEHPRRVFTRKQIALRIWDGGLAGADMTISTHVYRVRKKLTAAGCSEDLIKTHRGLGYALYPPE